MARRERSEETLSHSTLQGISPDPRHELKTSYMALDAYLMAVPPPPSIILLA